MHRRFRIRALTLIALLITLLSATVAFAEYYKVRDVKRLDKDLYRSSDGLYIETKYCYQYTYGEDAVLKWEGKHGDNKIIWADDSKCEVKNVWKK